MSQGFAVFILMNNYFHDVATAMLLACGVALHLILKQAGDGPASAVAASSGRLVKGINAAAWFSIVWIVLSGSVRIGTFKQFEWANAVEKHHETGLIVKYVLAGLILVAGASVWLKARKRAAAVLRLR